MIRDEETGWVEPRITINGVVLTFAQAMSVRVAVSSFLIFVSDQTNRDHIGRTLADGYKGRLAEVEQLMRTEE